MVILLMAVIAPAMLNVKTVKVTVSAIGTMEVTMIAATVRFRTS